ncbi:MAG: hypothetical protein HY075_03380 [Deltaproteobacteria bacterium]|nr:hypothetical protein [Deltaproteobacteria bacterium]
MRPNRVLLRVLFLLASVGAFHAHAHEARTLAEQRQAIQARLRETGCTPELTSPLPAAARSLTRGGAATRGLTRGGENPTAGPRLVAAAEQYSNYFFQVIQAEFELPYGKPDDPKSHEFFREDPFEGPEKIAIQEELGVKWKGSEAPTSTPTWVELARNYRAALKRRGIDPASTFVPTMVLYRDLGQVPSPKTGKLVTKREYLFVDPLAESFPADMSKWRLLNKDVEFNIPFQPIFEAMQQGKFPLLDATHDVSHFVAFLRFPEFAAAVRARLKAASADGATSGFKGREYWLTEALSLPDPQGQAANEKFLRDQGRPTETRPVVELERELGKLDEPTLIDYAYKLARQLESQLRDVSGGNSNSSEKWYYLSESFGMKARDLLREDLSRSTPIGPVMALAKVYFENAPVSLHANPKALTNETATFNFNTFATAQKLLALSLKAGKLGGVARADALRQLVRFASRTESLLTQRPFSYAEWAESFLKPDLSASDPIAKMLTGLFSNDVVARFYLGKGQAR